MKDTFRHDGWAPERFRIGFRRSRSPNTCISSQAEDKPVPRTELVRGFEYDRDHHVVLEDHELQRLAPSSSQVMEVREFVPAAELDPVYLDASYYVAPQNGGEKPYALLFEALRRRSGYVALAHAER